MGWYKDFFDEWYLKYWVKPLSTERTHRETEAIIRFLQLEPKDKVLDLCCGQGRHSLELSRRGYRVVGYDLSETLLEESRKLAKEEALSVEFVKGDMRELPFVGEFAGIFNFYTAFGYFERDEDNQAVLTTAAKALKPGGRFLLDYPCLEGRMKNWLKQEFFEYADGTIMLHNIKHNVFHQTIENDVLYITRDNRRHRTGFTLRHYYPRELQRCFEQAGLKVVSVYGDLEGSVLSNSDTRILVVGEKPASSA